MVFPLSLSANNLKSSITAPPTIEAYSSILAISGRQPFFYFPDNHLSQFFQGVGIRVKPGNSIRQLFVSYGMLNPAGKIVCSPLKAQAGLKNMEVYGIYGYLTQDFQKFSQVRSRVIRRDNKTYRFYKIKFFVLPRKSKLRKRIVFDVIFYG